jgi:hypothetical protein
MNVTKERFSLHWLGQFDPSMGKKLKLVQILFSLLKWTGITFLHMEIEYFSYWPGVDHNKSGNLFAWLKSIIFAML